MTRYFVTAVEKCPECGGSGLLQHWAWMELRKQQPGVLTDQQIKDFFVEYAGGRPDVNVPDEENTCYECEGTGTIQRRVDLSQALAGSYRELETRVDVLEEWRDATEYSERVRVLEMQQNELLRRLVALEKTMRSDGALLLIEGRVDTVVRHLDHMDARLSRAIDVMREAGMPAEVWDA